MASSSIITSIKSLLHHLDDVILHSVLSRQKVLLEKQKYRLRNLRTFVLCATKLGNHVHQRSNDNKRVRNLKAFVLCATKLGNHGHQRSNDNKNEDASLGSLLISIEDAVGRYAPKIYSSRTNFSTRFVKKHASSFESDIQPSRIDEWYITMSDYTRQSTSLTPDEIVEIIQSILEGLVDFPFPGFSEITVDPMEALREHMEFLKNFCRFVTESGVEHGQIKDFLTHAEAAAINAAHLCFLCGADNYYDEEWRKAMQFKISKLFQKIKPIDPQVYKAYHEALSCSKCPTRLQPPTQDMDDDSTIVMKNFLDSLISVLWYTLQHDTGHVFSLKDPGQILYEELRSLRITLKKLPNNIVEKTKDVIRAEVCDAGVLFCSFYQKNVEMDLDLEGIKTFLAKVEGEVPQASKFNSPRIDELDFIDFLLENLEELTNDKVEPVVKSRVQTIKEELLHLRSFLEGTVKGGALWNHVLEALYQLEFLIDHLVVGDISDSFSMQFDSVLEDLRNIRADHASKNFDGKREDVEVKEVAKTHSPLSSPTTEVVGFCDEAKSIVERLTRGSKKLQVIAIVGMGGCGKTTLATKVYNDPSVVLHFHVRAWRPVSQTLDKKALLLELLNQIPPEKDYEMTEDDLAKKFYEMTEDDLAEKLWRRLKGRRHLIFLDDIWTIEAWNSLKGSFPDDSNGSRIILTSRNCNATSADMLDQEPHSLCPLTQDESLELLRRKLFPGDDNWPPVIRDLGMQIAGECRGLPLAIVLVAGLLAATKQEGWKEIVDSLSSRVVSSMDQCIRTLELSYQHLPDYLKPCLLYFGTFPEDKEVSVRKLIRLWIAEGFVRKDKLKSLEDVAEDYMKDLIGRSLIMVAKQRSMGGVKSCRIHDLLHDFCLHKAKDKYFFHLLKGQDELLAFNEPCNLRRLCIHSKQEHLGKPKLFCPRARSLRFFSDTDRCSIDLSFVIHIFKLVRVLDFGGIYLGKVFPSEIELLTQLRYLAIRGSFEVIPSSVGNLSMLETLIVDPCEELVTLPDTIWKLRKLTFVFIGRDGGTFPIKNLDNNSVLYELDRISGVVFKSKGSMEKQMRKFPNIRKLKCHLCKGRGDAEEFPNIVILDFLGRLESLHMSALWRSLQSFDFRLPANLRKLTLRNFGFPWSEISTFGKLPNLEVLKLHSYWGASETWEMEEGEFPKLKYLKLSELRIVRWTVASDDQFPRLQKLVLERCESLEEMPCDCLGSSTPTLEMIEVSHCSKATRSLVKQIKEQQMNFGNSSLKLIMDSSDDDYEELLSKVISYVFDVLSG